MTLPSASIDVNKRRMIHEQMERSIKWRVAQNGWKDNVVSRYLAQANLCPNQLGRIMGINRCTVSKWVHTEQKDLAPFVQFVFLAFAKLKMQGVSVEDYF